MIAIINIASFRGVSIGAMHYYGRLIILGLSSIELFRPINKSDLDNYPDRFEGYEIGELTGCFNSWREVIIAGGEIAKENDIDLKDVVVEGIPNIGRISYDKAIGPLDTRLKCKKCGKIIKPGEGGYNTPRGFFCTKCY